MTYLAFVAGAGAAGAIFLFLRDLRIYGRTGLSGYRQAALHGLFYSALSSFGAFVAFRGGELLGLGLVLAGLYLQGRVKRERVWRSEGTLDRILGRTGWKEDKGKK